MTIDDELIRVLTQPDSEGNVPLIKMLNIKDIKSYKYHIEQTERFFNMSYNELIVMTPDIVVTHGEDEHNRIISLIEVENHIKWDFSQSIQQIKKYIEFFPNRGWKKQVIVLIPLEYDRYEDLYKNEGVDVWLWDTNIKYECLDCGEFTSSKKISNIKCKCHSNNLIISGIDQLTLINNAQEREINVLNER